MLCADAVTAAGTRQRPVTYNKTQQRRPALLAKVLSNDVNIGDNTWYSVCQTAKFITYQFCSVTSFVD